MLKMGARWVRGWVRKNEPYIPFSTLFDPLANTFE